MRFARQLFVELRNDWQLGIGIALFVGVMMGLQNPIGSVRPLVGDGWLVTAYVGVTATFGAVFTTMLFGAYTAVEDKFNFVYHRLLVYPVSFPRVLATRTVPVAIWASLAAAAVGVGVWITAPDLAARRVVVAVAVVAAFTLPLATLMTLLYLFVSRPRIGTAVLFAVLFGVVYLPRRVIETVTLPSGEVAAVVVLTALLTAYLVTYLAAVRIDPERIVVA